MNPSSEIMDREARARSRRMLGRVVTIWIVMCYAMVEWPILEWANRSEPFVMGVPFAYFWITSWYAMMTLGGIFAAAYVWRP